MQATNTRLIIKNIPKHVDERRLRLHFSERGQVTDAKIVRTKDGKSRQFAFVGFGSENDAKEALTYYNSTFLDTSRIQVERAQPKGDPGIARPWSKHSDGSSRAQRLAEAKVRKGKGKEREKLGGDSVSKKEAGRGSTDRVVAANTARTGNASGKGNIGKEEFIATLTKRSEARFWDNDDALDTQPQAATEVHDADDVTSDEDDADDSGLDNARSDSESSDDAKNDPRKASEQLQKKSGSDMDWLRSKVANEGDHSDSEEESESDGDSDADDGDSADESSADEIRGTSQSEKIDKKWGEGDRGRDRNAGGGNADSSSMETKDEKELVHDDESGLAIGRLFVRNLPYVCTEDDLRELFEGFGMLSEVHLPVDDFNKGKGFAFVQFVIPEDAKKAMDALDRHAFQGRLLHIIPARQQPGTPGVGGDLFGKGASAANKTYKEQKEESRKAKAGDSAGWNASFVRADTVVDALADRLGVDKSDILDREEGDMAVRLALGETHLVKENKDYFEQEGVDLNALESSKAKGGGKVAEERSNTVILVKNLPYTTEAADLAKRFGAFGDVGRVLLPPSKAVALVEFLKALDARRAFKRLAYTRFQHVPLYLEWAPLKALKEDFKPSSKPVALPSSAKAAAGEETKVDEDEVEAGRAFEEPLTLFVKNLSFSTKEAALRACFEREGLRVRSVSIPKRRGKGASEAMLSSGIGFVECSDANVAEKALTSLQGTVLDGHALELKRSTKRLTKKPGVKTAESSEAKSSKLIIRNVPFQATAKEVRELFSCFGQLKRVRLPKKFDGGHRGFAFVDFLTPQEALNAKMSLESTHLYGRHLVGEWAEDKEDMDTLRAKASRDIRGPGDSNRSAKRRKADDDGFDDMDGL